MNILATLVVYLVASHQGGDPSNVRIILEPKIEATSCVELVDDLIEMNEPMTATIVEPGMVQEVILFNPKNLICEPYNGGNTNAQTF